MKKFLTLALLFIATLVFSQTFTNQYNSAGYKNPGQTEFTYNTGVRTEVEFNNNTITVYVAGVDPMIMKQLTSPKIAYSNGARYQFIQVSTVKGGEIGYLALFDDPNTGCVLVFKNGYSFAFFNR